MAKAQTGKGGKPAPVVATPQTARALLTSVHAELIKSVTVTRNGDFDDFLIELDWLGLQSYNIDVLHLDINGVWKSTYIDLMRHYDFQPPIPTVITMSWPHGGMSPKTYYIGVGAEGGWVTDGETKIVS